MAGSMTEKFRPRRRASSSPVSSPAKCSVLSASWMSRSRLSPLPRVSSAPAARRYGSRGDSASVVIMVIMVPSVVSRQRAHPGGVRARFGGRECRPRVDGLLERAGGRRIVALRQVHDSEVVVRGGCIAGREKFLAGSVEVARRGIASTPGCCARRPASARSQGLLAVRACLGQAAQPELQRSTGCSRPTRPSGRARAHARTPGGLRRAVPAHRASSRACSGRLPIADEIDRAIRGAQAQLGQSPVAPEPREPSWASARRGSFASARFKRACAASRMPSRRYSSATCR